ncbi:hypothetical protein NC651_014467 [Populus alba x Populus x berolinensis]|nr:hypothetical protein NC651_014467 [Populus alba x Populus x berolinensis]
MRLIAGGEKKKIRKAIAIIETLVHVDFSCIEGRIFNFSSLLFPVLTNRSKVYNGACSVNLRPRLVNYINLFMKICESSKRIVELSICSALGGNKTSSFR